MIKLYPSFNNIATQSTQATADYANLGSYPLVNYHKKSVFKSTSNITQNSAKRCKPNNEFTQYSFTNLILATCNVVYKSYNEIKNLGKVMPLDYINSINTSEIGNNQITDYNVLPWTKCLSLVNTGEKIYVPIQMLFTDCSHNNNDDEQSNISPLGTGIASHSSYFKAMEKAILDNISVDAFMLTMLTKQKYKKIIFNNSVLNLLQEHKLLGDECDFEITPLYITQPDLKVPTFAVILKRKNQLSPYMLMPIQSDLDPLEALLYGIINSISRAKSILKNTMISSNKISEFYKNSLYWVMPHDIVLKDKSVSELIEGDINFSEIKTYHQQSNQKNVTYLINELQKISNYAIFMNVMQPKFRAQNKYVVRVLVPELLKMPMFDGSYVNHPRLQQFDSRINNYNYSIF
ncbi:YcaO-like family protein [Clostridium sp. 'deep sea']|uniref:YcaO-like family protein n=1 Tax=Clostridium sp. 'deep sea' TaxID=2779445 RepID=UPI0018966764|nr:YcaO-like family protein [Clostridium sp. 'deep sea']QOR35281.1 YcaO-like family protein [Clostridium sp. 'deep sea']